jgi:hypothetical protein
VQGAAHEVQAGAAHDEQDEHDDAQEAHGA